MTTMLRVGSLLSNRVQILEGFIKGKIYSKAPAHTYPRSRVGGHIRPTPSQLDREVTWGQTEQGERCKMQQVSAQVILGLC